MSAPRCPMFDFIGLFVLRQSPTTRQWVPGLAHSYPLDLPPPAKEMYEKAAVFAFPDSDHLARIHATNAFSSDQFSLKKAPFMNLLLTGSDGARKHFFCLRLYVAGYALPCALAVGSDYHWPIFFRHLLTGTAERFVEFGSFDKAVDLATILRKKPIPLPNTCIKITMPVHPVLPSTYLFPRPNDDNGKPGFEDIETVLNAIGIPKLTAVFVSILLERRIVVVSANVEKLSRSVIALSQTTWPFKWQHMLIPIVPSSLLTYVEAPMPFILGLMDFQYLHVKNSLRGVVIVDLDRRDVSGALEDTEHIPASHMMSLRQSLSLIPVSNPAPDKIFSYFRTFLAKCVGTYEQFFVRSDSGAAFDFASYLENRGKSERFIADFAQSQMFQQFITEKAKEIDAAGTVKRTAFDDSVDKENPREQSTILGKAKGIWKDWTNTGKPKSKTPPPVPARPAKPPTPAKPQPPVPAKPPRPQRPGSANYSSPRPAVPSRPPPAAPKPKPETPRTPTPESSFSSSDEKPFCGKQYFAPQCPFARFSEIHENFRPGANDGFIRTGTLVNVSGSLHVPVSTTPNKMDLFNDLFMAQSAEVGVSLIDAHTDAPSGGLDLLSLTEPSILQPEASTFNPFVSPPLQSPQNSNPFLQNPSPDPFGGTTNPFLQTKTPPAQPSPNPNPFDLLM